MHTLSILLMTPRTTAIFEILFLLIVAAIIGFVTGWFYKRAEYRRNIREMDDSINELKSRTSHLNSENKSLRKNLVDRTRKYEQATFELSALEAKHKEELQKIVQKESQKEKLPPKTIEKKQNDLKQKQSIDYNSFGTAVKANKDDLKVIKGIGPVTEKRLHDLKIFTFSQISKFAKKDIDAIEAEIEYLSGRIERDDWVTQAKKLVAAKQ